MMGEKGYRYWKNMGQVSEKIENFILGKGMFTGSYIFGGFDGRVEKSDVDILLPPECEYLWSDLFSQRRAWYQQGEYRGYDFITAYIRCRFTEHPVNLIILLSDEAFSKWQTATNWMKRLAHEDELKQMLYKKKTRVLLFEMLKSFAEDC